jgi:hypothetical protein
MRPLMKTTWAALIVGGMFASSLSVAAPKIPRLASGKPDFSGIWQTTSAAEYDLEPHAGRADAPPSAGVIEGNVIPYLPAALERKKKNFAARNTEDPRLKCWTLGTPRGIYYREPFQILQRDRDLTLVFEFGHSVRTIHTNGTLHPEVTDNEFYLGDSRGHWEGDTLVVDVTNLSDKNNYRGSRDTLHLVERFKRVGNALRYEVTAEDAKTWTAPWTAALELEPQPDGMFEYACHEGNNSMRNILSGARAADR